MYDMRQQSRGDWLYTSDMNGHYNVEERGEGPLAAWRSLPNEVIRQVLVVAISGNPQ
jgi:hypothetical protein